MFSAIVYNSCTGSCQRYAEKLSAQLHIPAFKLGKEHIRYGTKIIYVGWAFAGKIVGYDKVTQKYNVGAVVQVGMSPTYDKLVEIGREKNNIGPDVPLFMRQGGFYMDKLPLPFKLIMKIKTKDIAKRYEGKENLTAQEKATYKMASTGNGDPACWCVKDIVEWCSAN